MVYTFDVELFSDFYKETNGFRPRDHEFYSASDGRKQEIWDSLMQDHGEELEAEGILMFQSQICENRALGAATDEDAVRWIADAEGWTETKIAQIFFPSFLDFP